MPDLTIEIGGQLFEVARGPDGRVRAALDSADGPRSGPARLADAGALQRRLAQLERENAALRAQRRRDQDAIDELIAQVQPLIGLIARFKPFIEEV